MVKRNIEPHDC